MSSVAVYSYSHSVTYVADNILKSFKDIIRLSGLNPADLVTTWASKMLAIETWIKSGHLEAVVLEIYHPTNDSLIIRWDIDIVYSWSADAGNFWTDTEQLRYAIKKAGVAPSDAKYRLVLTHKLGAPEVVGWSSTTFRSTDNMVRQSLGSTIEHNGLGGSTSYWRKL